MRNLCLLASFALLFVACDRSDRVACNQYADAFGSLDCGTDGSAIRDFCESDDPCADEDSAECVALWDCFSSITTCDTTERARKIETCRLAEDLEGQGDIFAN